MTRPLSVTARPDAPHYPLSRMVGCVCGGTYRVDRRQPSAGIRAHQRTNLHLAWRATLEGA